MQKDLANVIRCYQVAEPLCNFNINLKKEIFTIDELKQCDLCVLTFMV